MLFLLNILKNIININLALYAHYQEKVVKWTACVQLHTRRHAQRYFFVQKLMNYKDINMTLRYAKADEEKKVAAVAKMF